MKTNKRKPPTFSVLTKYQHPRKKLNTISRVKLDRQSKNTNDFNNNIRNNRSQDSEKSTDRKYVVGAPTDNSFVVISDGNESDTFTENSFETSIANCQNDDSIESKYSDEHGSAVVIETKPSEVFTIDQIRSGSKFRWKVIKGWSSNLNKTLWKVSKLDCSWSFKRADVFLERRNNTREVVVTGHCTYPKCSATLNASTKNNITKIFVDVFNWDKSIPHIDARKRHITGIDRSTLAKKLKTSSAYATHGELARELMEDTDLEPSHLPKLGNNFCSYKFKLIRIENY